MKKVVAFAKIAVVILSVALAGTYYLAVPPEHQLFKFIAIACLVAAIGLTCWTGGRYSAEEK